MSEPVFDENYEYTIVDDSFPVPKYTDYLSLLRADAGLVSKELGESLEEYYSRCCVLFGQSVHPHALIAMGDKKKYCIVMLTLGNEADEGLNALKKEDDLLLSLAASMFLDAWLFSMEEPLMKTLRGLCGKHTVGIKRRLELGNELPIEEQSDICKLAAAWQIGISCSRQQILTPSKSMSIVYELTTDTGCFQAHHDCGSCERYNCAMRKDPMKKTVTILVENMGKKILGSYGERLLPVLKRNGIPIIASCGGSGVCGACRIQVISGPMDITKEDRRFFSEEELAEGKRLSCTARLTGDLRIRIPQKRERTIQTIAGSDDLPARKGEAPYAIAIDIGTTTLAAELFTLADGVGFAYATAENPQRIHGADVLSRIVAACDGEKSKELQTLIREALDGLINKLCSANEIEPHDVKKIAISANVTMVHLLMGYSCEPLGRAPFIPVNADRIDISVKELLSGTRLDCPVVILPAISTFVGGDIVAGIMAQNIDESNELTLFIDAGTNGEMALGNRQKLFVASTAAGPAFEGCGISCGMASIPGAISGARLLGGMLKLETIGNLAPIGICGSGLLDLVSVLHTSGRMDDTGRLTGDADCYPVAESTDGRQIVLTQADIRQLQLAKAAIRAGVELLLAEANVRAEEIKRVYVAGGFGSGMRPESIAQIGMLPTAFAEHMVSVGNTSLRGAKLALTNPHAFERMERIRHISKEVVLAENPGFNERFVQEINF